MQMVTGHGAYRGNYAGWDWPMTLDVAALTLRNTFSKSASNLRESETDFENMRIASMAGVLDGERMLRGIRSMRGHEDEAEAGRKDTT